MLRPANVTFSASGRSPEPSQTRAFDAVDELQHAAAHHRALRVGQRVADVALGAGECAVVVVIGLNGVLARVDLDGRLLVGEQDPIALPLGKFAPRPVDVVAERDEDVAQVLALPRPRPCGDGAFADGQRWVWHQRLFGHPVDPSEPVALGARTDRGVRRERVGVQSFCGSARVGSGAGEKHPQQVRQGGDGADRRPRRRRTPALLQRDGGRQPGDVIDLRRAGGQQQASGVRSDRFEVAALGLGIDGPEGQRRFAGSGDPGERDQRVTRRCDVDTP